MRQLIRRYLHLITICAFVSFTIYNCQRIDDTETVQSNLDLNLSMTIFHVDDYFAKSYPKVFGALKNASVNNRISRTTEYSDDYQFYYDLDYIQVIERTNYIQYTVKVESDAYPNDLLNYILLDITMMVYNCNISQFILELKHLTV